MGEFKTALLEIAERNTAALERIASALERLAPQNVANQPEVESEERVVDVRSLSIHEATLDKPVDVLINMLKPWVPTISWRALYYAAYPEKYYEPGWNDCPFIPQHREILHKLGYPDGIKTCRDMVELFRDGKIVQVFTPWLGVKRRNEVRKMLVTLGFL